MLFLAKSIVLSAVVLAALTLIAAALPGRPQLKRDDVQAFKDAIICDANCYAAELRADSSDGTVQTREQDAQQMLTCAGRVTSMFNSKEEIKTNFGYCVQASKANRPALQDQHTECADSCF